MIDFQMLTTQNIYFIAKYIKLFDYRLNICIFVGQFSKDIHPINQAVHIKQILSALFLLHISIFFEYEMKISFINMSSKSRNMERKTEN